MRAVVPKGPPAWTRRLFGDEAELFGEVLAALRPAARQDGVGLRRLFARFGVPRQGRVLDIACGVGRHIVPLAEAGYRCVACDSSSGLLRQARTAATAANLGADALRFYRADYRHVDRILRRHGEPRFDAAICLFSSLGYYGEAADLATLRAVHRTVRPGGLFVLELANRDWILPHYRAEAVTQPTADLEQRERRQFDWERSTVRSVWTFYRRSGGQRRRVLEQEVRIRLYSAHELRSLLERAGWEGLATFGSLPRLERLSFDAHRLVVVGRRPGR